MADPLSYAICKKPLDENSEYVYVQEGNVISIIIFRNKGYYYTCTDAYTQNIHTHTPLSPLELKSSHEYEYTLKPMSLYNESLN